MGPEPVIMFLVFVVPASLVLGYSMNYRYKRRELQHRERMAALEKGLPLPELAEEISSPDTVWTPRTYQLRGLIWLFVGIGLAAFLTALSLTGTREIPTYQKVQEANSARRGGATEGEIQAIMLERDRQGVPIGLALLGLIPAGVGLAYLITYRSEMARQHRPG